MPLIRVTVYGLRSTVLRSMRCCTDILACNLHVFFFLKCVEGEGGEGGATEVAEGVAAAEGGEGAAVVAEGGEVQADAPPA